MLDIIFVFVGYHHYFLMMVNHEIIPKRTGLHIQNFSLIKYSIVSQFLQKIANNKQYLLYTQAESSLNGLTVTNEVCSVLCFLPEQLLASLFAYWPMIRWMVHVSHRT